MADSFASFGHKLERIERDLTDKRSLSRLGVAAKADVAEAVRGDLGDQSMSNWRRGKPIQIGGRFDVVKAGVLVKPAKGSAGPMRVLNDGRIAGMSRGRKGGKRKNGVVSTFSAPRPVSASKGKHTWDDAVKLMEKRTPGRVHDELGKVLRKHLTGR